jgi:hypothetical protein
MEGWFDTVNLDGIRFVFSNGIEELQTEIFGVQEDRQGEPIIRKKIDLPKQLTSVQTLQVNTQTETNKQNHSGWSVVNFGFNDDETLRLGFEDSSLA